MPRRAVDPDRRRRERALAEIAADRTRGASELARRCLELLAEHARQCAVANTGELREEMRRFTRALQSTRPNMAPVQNLLDRWLAVLADLHDSPDSARVQLVAHAQALLAHSRRAVSAAAEHAAALIAPGTTVITHSVSSSVREVFRLSAPKGVRAVITESRPLFEGRALACELSGLGIATVYITEAQMGLFVGRADLALTGADAVLWDGSVVNKSGTRLLALAARDAGLPFEVCCESFKFSRALAHEVALEEMAADELAAPVLAHVTPRNVYFDITPARLVSAWITERGVMRHFRDRSHATQARDDAPR